MNKFMIFNFLICILILSACSNQEKKWEKAKTKNTVSAFNKFIKQYPESQRIPEAKGLLSRLIISELNNTFGIKTDITDEQVKTYMEHFDQETFSTTVNSPVKYYKVSGNSCSGYLSKEKDIILPKEIGKACSLQLELGDLLITAFYSSNPSIKHPLFVDKRYPKMTHNGCSGPGLELRSTSKTETFLKTFLIGYNLIDGTGDYVIPDLIWGADETAGYGHNGEIFAITDETIKIEGLKCDINKLRETLISYKTALEIKTYIEIIAKKIKANSPSNF